MDNSEVRDRDMEKKQKGKQYSDERRQATTAELQPGDQVLLKKAKTNKLSANFHSTPASVICKQGNSVKVDLDGVQYNRNVVELKKFIPRIQEENSAVSVKNQSVKSRSILESQCQSADSRFDSQFEDSEDNSDQINTESELGNPDKSSPPDKFPDRLIPRPNRNTRVPSKYKDFVMYN
jgi:hypothetical protein